jgi:hypothetical protein
MPSLTAKPLLLDLEIPALSPGRQEKFVTTADPRVGPHGGIGRAQGRKAGKGLFHQFRLIVEKLAVETMVLQLVCRHITFLRKTGGRWRRTPLDYLPNADQ